MREKSSPLQRKIFMNSISWWAIIAYTLITTNLASLAVSIYLHRELTHKAIVLAPSCRNFFRFIIWFITGMDPVEWKVVHQAHHQAPSDSEKDFHSPHNEGMIKIIFFGVVYYMKACKILHKEIAEARPIIGDVFGTVPLRYMGVVLNLALNILLWGWLAGLVVWFIQVAWIPFWAAGVINGLGHGAKERHEHTHDMSKDILEDGPPILRIALNVITAGESNHHAHHLKPSAVHFATDGGFDYGFLVIECLRDFRLARPQ
jgi:stearoyl-CoA desaturase (Delta-9 desaturase)